jgi:RNA polymerase sigma-70 factor (ECF subfamily)
MTAEPNDAALLAHHAAGDPDAFAELVRRHRDRMWAVALRTLGDPDDAADAVQDALLAAHRNAASFRGQSKVSTWLHRIVVNACIDQTRRRKARPTVPLADDAAVGVSVPDPAVARDTSLSLLSALRSLPVEQAAAIVLIDVEGYPVAEAAEILEVPVGTVKSRCARGRASLAATLVDLDPRARNEEPSDAVQPMTPTHPAAMTDEDLT